MAGQTGTSSLLARYKGTKAEEFLNKRKEAEPELPGGGDLPAGIENGVAQVVLCGFGKVADGKPTAGALFFQAQAIVKLPKEKDGIPVQGRRTRIMKTVATAAQFAKGEYDEKAMAWVQDQLKMLAGKGADPVMFTLSRLESTAALILKAKPHTLFRTWKGGKSDVAQVNGKWWLCNLNDDGTVKATVTGKGPYVSKEAAQKANPYAGREPMVQHTWGGMVPAPQTAAAQSAVEDETPQIPVEEGTAGAGTGEEFNEFDNPQAAEKDFSTETDLDTLVKASEKSEEARVRLEALALAAGIKQEQINTAESWQHVANMIAEQTVGDLSSAGSTEEEEEAEGGEVEEVKWQPQVEEVYGYKPLVVGKDGKKVRGNNVVRCTVREVDTEKETVSIKNNADKKTLYKGVKWVDLLRLDS